MVHELTYDNLRSCDCSAFLISHVATHPNLEAITAPEEDISLNRMQGEAAWEIKYGGCSTLQAGEGDGEQLVASSVEIEVADA